MRTQFDRNSLFSLVFVFTLVFPLVHTSLPVSSLLVRSYQNVDVVNQDNVYASEQQYVEQWKSQFTYALNYEMSVRQVPVQFRDSMQSTAVGLCELETHFDYRFVSGAQNGPAGERGPCQFLPSTWNGLGYDSEYALDANVTARAMTDMFLAGRVTEWTTYDLLGDPYVWHKGLHS